MVEEEFACPQPSRIQVGKIASRCAVNGGFCELVRNQNSLHVEPHATGTEHGDKQHEFRANAQTGFVKTGGATRRPCYNLSGENIVHSISASRLASDRDSFRRVLLVSYG